MLALIGLRVIHNAGTKEGIAVMYITMIIISAVGAIAATLAACYAYKTFNIHREAAQPMYDIGFPEGKSVVTKNTITIDDNEMGQQVHFRVINKSKYPVALPWCSVRFPTVFKHPREAESSDMTINSTLGEVVINRGSQPSTHFVEDRSDGTSEARGILAAHLLRPNDPKDFWIRFKFPPKPDTWEIVINIDVIGVRSVSQTLTLIGRHS